PVCSHASVERPGTGSVRHCRPGQSDFLSTGMCFERRAGVRGPSAKAFEFPTVWRFDLEHLAWAGKFVKRGGHPRLRLSRFWAEPGRGSERTPLRQLFLQIQPASELLD